MDILHIAMDGHNLIIGKMRSEVHDSAAVTQSAPKSSEIRLKCPFHEQDLGLVSHSHPNLKQKEADQVILHLT